MSVDKVDVLAVMDRAAEVIEVEWCHAEPHELRVARDAVRELIAAVANLRQCSRDFDEARRQGWRAPHMDFWPESFGRANDRVDAALAKVQP